VGVVVVTIRELRFTVCGSVDMVRFCNMRFVEVMGGWRSVEVMGVWRSR
jgi:hypothetical protein